MTEEHAGTLFSSPIPPLHAAHQHKQSTRDKRAGAVCWRAARTFSGVNVVACADVSDGRHAGAQVEGYMYSGSQNRMRMRIFNVLDDVKRDYGFAPVVTRPAGALSIHGGGR